MPAADLERNSPEPARGPCQLQQVALYLRIPLALAPTGTPALMSLSLDPSTACCIGVNATVTSHPARRCVLSARRLLAAHLQLSRGRTVPLSRKRARRARSLLRRVRAPTKHSSAPVCVPHTDVRAAVSSPPTKTAVPVAKPPALPLETSARIRALLDHSTALRIAVHAGATSPQRRTSARPARSLARTPAQTRAKALLRWSPVQPRLSVGPFSVPPTAANVTPTKPRTRTSVSSASRGKGCRRPRPGPPTCRREDALRRARPARALRTTPAPVRRSPVPSSAADIDVNATATSPRIRRRVGFVTCQRAPQVRRLKVQLTHGPRNA